MTLDQLSPHLVIFCIHNSISTIKGLNHPTKIFQGLKDQGCGMCGEIELQSRNFVCEAKLAEVHVLAIANFV